MSFRIIIARIRLAVFCLAIASISALIVSPAAASAPETEITYVAAFAPEAATVVFETDQDAAEHTAEAATDQDAAEHTAETAAGQDATTEHAVEDEAHDDGHGPLPPIWMILPPVRCFLPDTGTVITPIIRSGWAFLWPRIMSLYWARPFLSNMR